MKLEELHRIRLELNGVKIVPTKMEDGEMDNPCWDGYEPIGLKPDGSPNCVPLKAKKER